MDALGRYYTQDLFSSLLIKQLTLVKPKKVLELGVGGGALLRAAIQRWSSAQFYAADIDKTAIRKISKELPFVRTKYANGLNAHLPDKLMLSGGSVDIAICNPPYMKEGNKTKYIDLFCESNLAECLMMDRITSDIVFLAQNLRLLKPDGQLGIILPDTLITGHEFELLRHAILRNHAIKGVIELPEKVFPKTEAKTHILIIEKDKEATNKVPLYITNVKGQCIDQIDVSSEDLPHRMDYTFHKWNQKVKSTSNLLSLKNVTEDIKRGSYTHAQLKAINRKYIHTTNLNNFSSIIGYKNPLPLGVNENNFAKKGDILLARVGRGCIGKVSIVEEGFVLFSDCIYRVRVKPEMRNKVWRSLTSNEGQEWFKANKHGVCAKVISKKDLINFPVK